MWLFTTFGFFSVVEHHDDSGVLLVRARAREDLVSLLQRAKIAPSKIQRTPDADYPYRVALPRALVSGLVAASVDRIDYANFKNAVAERQGSARARAYHDVWAEVRQIEDEGARGSVASRSRP